MLRTHDAGSLNAKAVATKVVLAGWVARRRDHGGVAFIDLRDSTGAVQVVINDEKIAGELRAEWCVLITGTVKLRPSGNENKEIPTGEIEVVCEKLEVLSEAAALPFPVDSGDIGNISEEVRLKYRYLDLRREGPAKNLRLRSKVTTAIREVMSEANFLEIETPYLTRSTPEGARDFLVPVRLQPGSWYALPQSPQLFKQLLMVAGMERYYQIARCFRDEDLRADRQPEFTQIDCEMTFVEQEDILNQFEGLTQHLLKSIKGIEPKPFPRMSYDNAMKIYGNDKPDIRFGMTFCELNDLAQGKGFGVFDSQELVVGIAVPKAAEMTRKEIDGLIDWVKRPQIGAKGLIWVKCNADGSHKSSVDKFFNAEDLAQWAERCDAIAGDLILVLSGDANTTRTQLSALRMELGERLGLRKPEEFAPLWVTDFPLLEWDEESKRYHAMHHPFTSPKPDQLELLKTDPGAVKANAYDLVLNGNEIGGGSIRIHDQALQSQMFDLLGFSKAEAQAQFGFLMDAFQFGAPPHGGIAFGLDRLVAILGGEETIRDFIAFPKNNSGRDIMIDAPAEINPSQLEELSLKSIVAKKK